MDNSLFSGVDTLHCLETEQLWILGKSFPGCFESANDRNAVNCVVRVLSSSSVNCCVHL
jgi:hypothetical protein